MTIKVYRNRYKRREYWGGEKVYIAVEEHETVGDARSAASRIMAGNKRVFKYLGPVLFIDGVEQKENLYGYDDD
jgi:hypothetical protein